MKKFAVISLIFTLVLLTAFIKNSTKRIDDMIFISKENIRSLNSDFENIKLEYDYPLDGVYLTRTVVKEKNYVGLASLGNKPTFNGSEKILEVFILDFDEDIYSQNIEVYFLEEIRKQIKFSNEDELIKRMNEDHKYAIINSKKYGI